MQKRANFSPRFKRLQKEISGENKRKRFIKKNINTRISRVFEWKNCFNPFLIIAPCPV